jgi:hypothetical protein
MTQSTRALGREADGDRLGQRTSRWCDSYACAVPSRLRSEGIVLVPALPVVALLVYFAAHGGGYQPTTWEPGALVVLGLLVATLAGLGFARLRLARPAAIALAALAAYVAWSYLSIAWAPSPGDALEGSNRALLFLLLFALFALLPWRTWTALVALSAFALGIATIAVVTLARVGSAGDVATLFHDGRLTSPAGYENGSAALFLVGGIVAVALAARRELPVALRALLAAGATAALQTSVLCESRGWLFSLPIVLIVAVALMPGRVRFVLWALPSAAGTLAALPALLDVFHRVDGATSEAAAARALADAGAHASSVALRLCALVLVATLALALLDRRVPVPTGVARSANRLAAGLAILAALTGVAIGLAATHGRPDHTIAHYWDRSHGYQSAASGSSRFALVGSNRPDFWRVSLDTFAAHPLGGLGQDNWGDYYTQHRHADEQPRWTHSLELRLLAHTGLVGFLLFVAFLVAALAATLGGRRRAGALASAASATALLPLVVWVVYGSIDWFWEIPALSGPAFAFLGLATAGTRQLSGLEPAPEPPAQAATAPGRARAKLATAGVALATLLAALVVAFPYLAERDVAAATTGWRTDPSAAFRRLDDAARLNRLSSQPALVGGVIALELRRSQEAQRRFTAAIARDRGNWFAWFGRGLAASELRARREAARMDFAQAHALNPREQLAIRALRRIGTRRPLTVAEAFGDIRQSVERLTGTPRRSGHA